MTAHEDLRSVAELTNQATHLRRAGHAAEAVAAYREALARADENGEPMLRAMVRVNAGTAFTDVGDRQAATRAYEEALEILGPGAEPSPVLLLGTTNLGVARLAAGDLDGAERHLTDALLLAGRLGERVQQGVAIGHLGSVAFARGELAAAFEQWETAIAVADEERDLWSLQQFQTDLATGYSRLGLHREALGAFAVARDISVAAGDPRAEAQCLHGLGLNQLLDGDERAHATLEAALSAFLRLGDLHAALDAALTLTRAWVAHAAGLGDRGLADAFMRDALLPDDAAVVDPDALATARQWLVAADELAESAAAGPAATAVARHHLLRLGGEAEAAAQLLETLSEGAADGPDALDPATRAAVEQSLGGLLHGPLGRPADAAVRFDRALELRRGPAGARPALEDGAGLLAAQLRDDVTPLAVRAAAATAAAGDIAGAFARTEEARGAAPAVPADEVAAALAERPGTALVSFLTGADVTLAVVFPPGGDPAVRTLPVGAAVLARDWWLPLAAARAAVVSSGDQEAWESAVGHVLADVGARLLAPVADLLGRYDVRHLVLVPHGLLHALPLHAAPVDDTSRNRTWLDDHAVSYAPSASAAVRLWRAGTPPPAEVVAVGDPTGDLPLAAVEAARAVVSAERRGPLLLGPRTSRDELAAALGPGRWVHWAGHARDVLDDARGAGLLHGVPADGEAELLELPPPQGSGAGPLAGAVVVLSACETGVVAPYPAAGATGLAGALLAAGASAVVSTRWEVGEACAALVMEGFYDALAAGAPLPEALRAAQLAVRDLTEDAVHDLLGDLLEAAAAEPGARWAALEPYRYRRASVTPFAHPEAWGAFALTGAGSAPALQRPG